MEDRLKLNHTEEQQLRLTLIHREPVEIGLVEKVLAELDDLRERLGLNRPVTQRNDRHWPHSGAMK